MKRVGGIWKIQGKKEVFYKLLMNNKAYFIFKNKKMKDKKSPNFIVYEEDGGKNENKYRNREK